MSTHTFKRGDIVAIFNCTHSGQFIVEGMATILRPARDADERYHVRFHGKDGKPSLGEEYERFVDRQGQDDPAAYAQHLTDMMPKASREEWI